MVALLALTMGVPPVPTTNHWTNLVNLQPVNQVQICKCWPRRRFTCPDEECDNPTPGNCYGGEGWCRWTWETEASVQLTPNTEDPYLWDITIPDEGYDILIPGLEFKLEGTSILYSNEYYQGWIDLFRKGNTMIVEINGDIQEVFEIGLKPQGRQIALQYQQAIPLAPTQTCKCQVSSGSSCSDEECDTAEMCQNRPRKHCKWFLGVTQEL